MATDLHSAKAFVMLIQTPWIEGQEASFKGAMMQDEQKTKESEQTFKAIFDNAADGILLADVETKKFYTGNHVICQMLGIDKEEINDLGVMDIHPEQDLPYVVEQFDKQARGEITLAKDIPVKRKNGSVFYADVNAFPITMDGNSYLMGIFRDVSEHKIAEEKWRSLVETAPGIILTVSSDGTIQSLNRTTGDITVEQAIGTTVYEYVESGQCDIIRRSIEKVFQTGEPDSYEILARGPDGPNSAWYETRLGPVIRDGRVDAVTMISTDITERKKAENALRESEARYRTLVEQLPAITYIAALDETSTTLYVSPQVKDLIGFTTEEYKSDPDIWQKQLHPNDRDRVLQTVHRSHAEKKPFAEEYRMIAKNGSVVWLRDEAVIVKDEKNQPLFLQGVMYDITEHKKAENALTQSEEKFRLAMEATNDALWDWDIATNKVYRNPRHATMLGYESNELTASQDEWENRIHPDDKKAILQILDEYLAGKRESFETEYRLRTKSGDYVWVLGRGKVVTYNDDGSPARMIGTNIDITERKRMEEAVRMSEEKYRTFFKYDLTGDFISTPDGDLIDCNQAFLDLFGFNSMEEAQSITLDSVYPTPADREVMLDKIRKERKIFHYVHEARKITGETIFIDQNTVGEFDDDNNLILMRGHIIDITEHKKAEEALQESELRYRTLFEILPVGIGLSTLDGRIIDGNSTFQRMIGYSIEEARQINVLDTYYNPTERAPILKQLQQNGFVRDFEVQLKRKDGTIFLARLNVTTMEMRDETVSVTVARDVTEHRRMERALAENEEKYRTLVESAGDPISTLDERGVFLFANKVAAEDLGYQPEDLVGKTLWDFFPKEMADQSAANIRKVIETGQRINTVSLREVQGQPRWYSATIEPLRDEHGSVTAAMVIVRDIDDMKRAEEQIHKLSSAVESSISGIAIGDAEGNMTYVNHAFLEMWGYDHENEVLGRNVIELWEMRDEAENALNTVRDRNGWIGELAAKKKDGSGMDVQVCVTLVTDENDRPISIMGSFIDITVSKRREEELSKYRGQMARAEQLASLGTLSATMAHQLTQPLTVIRLSMDNALDELEASSSSETVIRRLKDSVTQVSHITSIIERFRNFARKSSGRTVAEVNLKAVAVRIARLLSESARSASIILSIKNMDDLPCPWINENDLEQLFFALIENAIQATDGKKARQLVISGAVKDEHIELSISDDCGGISPENIDKIFEPFFTTKPRGQGTGLGLCIVQDVVSRIGGRIRIESKFGKGTTFTICLPFEQGKIS
jgi:PAS domain S-box-containing protein